MSYLTYNCDCKHSSHILGTHNAYGRTHSYCNGLAKEIKTRKFRLLHVCKHWICIPEGTTQQSIMSAKNCQLRRIHLKTFLACLIVLYGLTLAELIGTVGSAEENSSPERLHGRFQDQFKTGEKHAEPNISKSISNTKFSHTHRHCAHTGSGIQWVWPSYCPSWKFPCYWVV